MSQHRKVPLNLKLLQGQSNQKCNNSSVHCVERLDSTEQNDNSIQNYIENEKDEEDEEENENIFMLKCKDYYTNEEQENEQCLSNEVQQQSSNLQLDKEQSPFHSSQERVIQEYNNEGSSQIDPKKLFSQKYKTATTTTTNQETPTNRLRFGSKGRLLKSTINKQNPFQNNIIANIVENEVKLIQSAVFSGLQTSLNNKIIQKSYGQYVQGIDQQQQQQKPQILLQQQQPLLLRPSLRGSFESKDNQQSKLPQQNTDQQENITTSQVLQQSQQSNQSNIIKPNSKNGKTDDILFDIYQQNESQYVVEQSSALFPPQGEMPPIEQLQIKQHPFPSKQQEISQLNLATTTTSISQEYTQCSTPPIKKYGFGSFRRISLSKHATSKDKNEDNSQKNQRYLTTPTELIKRTEKQISQLKELEDGPSPQKHIRLRRNNFQNENTPVKSKGELFSCKFQNIEKVSHAGDVEDSEDEVDLFKFLSCNVLPNSSSLNDCIDIDILNSDSPQKAFLVRKIKQQDSFKSKLRGDSPPQALNNAINSSNNNIIIKGPRTSSQGFSQAIQNMIPISNANGLSPISPKKYQPSPKIYTQSRYIGGLPSTAQANPQNMVFSTNQSSTFGVGANSKSSFNSNQPQGLSALNRPIIIAPKGDTFK